MKIGIFLCFFSWIAIANNPISFCFKALAAIDSNDAQTMELVQNSYSEIIDSFSDTLKISTLKQMIEVGDPFTIPENLEVSSNTLNRTLSEFRELLTEKNLDTEPIRKKLLDSLSARVGNVTNQEQKQTEHDSKPIERTLKWKHDPYMDLMPHPNGKSVLGHDRAYNLTVLNGQGEVEKVAISLSNELRKQFGIKINQKPRSAWLTPEGEHLVFEFENSSQFFIAKLESENGAIIPKMELQPFVNGLNAYSDIRFSSDGKRFALIGGDKVDVYKMGFPPEKITQKPIRTKDLQEIIFSKDGKQLFVASETIVKNYAIKASGAAQLKKMPPIKLGSTSRFYPHRHSSAPHPTKPLFVYSDKFTDVHCHHIAVLDLKTGKVESPPVKTPTFPSTAFHIDHLTISPDGRYYYIVYEPAYHYTNKPAGNAQLVIYDSQTKKSALHELKAQEVSGISVRQDGGELYISYPTKREVSVLPTDMLTDPGLFELP